MYISPNNYLFIVVNFSSLKSDSKFLITQKFEILIQITSPIKTDFCVS